MLLKRLPYLFALLASISVDAQSFPLKKVNDDYVLTFLPIKEDSLNKPLRIKRDTDGLYWFSSMTKLKTFDGVNWKYYDFQNPAGKNVVLRMNDFEVMDDGSLWLATEGAGNCLFDKSKGTFIPARQLYPEAGKSPEGTNCLYKGKNSFACISIINEGFFVFDLLSKKIKHIVLDSTRKVFVPNSISPITADSKGNYWGITRNNLGIWWYNIQSGKLNCSWKGEFMGHALKRYQSGITGVTYSEKHQSLWISYGSRGILEKLKLSTGNSQFYSFTGSLQIQNETTAQNKLGVNPVKIDPANNLWLIVGGKFLVKVGDDIGRFEYLENQLGSFPLVNGFVFLPEKPAYDNVPEVNHVLLWIIGDGQVGMIRKRIGGVRHIPFDTTAKALAPPNSYENADGRKNVFFEKGRNGYYILQQNANRPKVICLDKDLRITNVMLNGELEKYPAYFSTEFNPDSFFIALMRPGNEPLDFRNVIVDDYKIDLRAFTASRLNLSFEQRVYKYGCADAFNVYWLFSNGHLYSYDPKQQVLDSIFICKPAEKKEYELELVKGFDYPTVLHKASSTFWIAFFPTKELYKVNLKTRKIEKIFKSCFDRKECTIPSGVADMYVFDSTRIFLQVSFSAVLINAFNDSLTHQLDLFNNKLPVETPGGSIMYKKWFTVVVPSGVFMLNMITGEQRRLRSNVDFNGRASQLNCKPLINDKGEMIIMASDQKRFVVFNLDSVQPQVHPGPVKLSSIKIDNKDLSLDSVRANGISMKYNRYGSIYLNFSDYTLTSQEERNYEYAMFNGGDTVWNKIEGKSELTFSKISPGDYQLLLRANNGYGDYSPSIATLDISIIPPIWQRASFIIFCALLILLGIVIYTRARIRSIRRKESEKLSSVRRMAELELQSLRSQLNPHFMFNSLNAIQELILMEENEKSQSYLARFAKLLRIMLENADKPIVPLQSELDFLRLYLSLENLRIPDLQYSIKVDHGIDMEETMIPNMILQPYIENALWHGLSYKEGDRQLQIRIAAQNGTTLYEIEDNGVGRKKAAELKSMYRKAHKSKGMELLSKRFKLLAKEYGTDIEASVTDLVSHENVSTGTLVTIKVPANITFLQKKATV